MSVLPLRDRTYLQQRGIVFQEIDGPQKGVIFPDYVLPCQRFDVALARILIMLPPGYPDVRPDMFYALPWLKLVNGNKYPKAADVPVEYHGETWQRWSRHSDEWRPGVDGIWTMLRRIDTALEEAA
ncbi:MAG: hypothetical protein KGZ91_00150 [Afipia sp.]|nr:hypothetical protein [Afipia sp.]